MITRRAFALSGAAAATTLAAPAIAQAPTKVKLGVPNAATDVGYFVAHARGYFKDEGLDVEMIPFDSAARMIAPMASGDLQVAAGGPSAGFYNGFTRGLDMRMVAVGPVRARQDDSRSEGAEICQWRAGQFGEHAVLSAVQESRHPHG